MLYKDDISLSTECAAFELCLQTIISILNLSLLYLSVYIDKCYLYVIISWFNYYENQNLQLKINKIILTDFDCFRLKKKLWLYIYISCLKYFERMLKSTVNFFTSYNMKEWIKHLITGIYISDWTTLHVHSIFTILFKMSI